MAWIWPDDYITISHLTQELQLPRSYVNKLVAQGIIPTITVNGRKRATEKAARAALDELAARTEQNATRRSVLS